MGNDGGSIPTRRELVKEAARAPTASELRATLTETLAHRWRHCQLTDAPLRPPIVADALGRLYNKDSVIELLLPVDEADDAAVARREEMQSKVGDALRALKDVVEVRFEAERDGKELVCPVTRKKLDETTRAVYVVPCGHAFAEAAVKETMSAATASAEKGMGDAALAEEKPLCLTCSEAYAPNDVIPILPTNEIDIARLSLRIERLKEIGLSHSLKKAGGKKRKKNGEKKDKDEKATKASTAKTSGNGIQNASTASITAKVLNEQDLRNKKRKMEQSENQNLQSLYSKQPRNGGSGKNSDFMTRGFAVPTQQQR